MKYPISKEFFPVTLFKAPTNLRMIRSAQKFMGIPGYLWKDPELSAEKFSVPAYKGGEIDIYMLTPKNTEAPMPCLVYYHGGGFIFEGYGSHFRLAMRYAKEVACKVIYVKYRLAPDHPFPYPQEDCYLALRWIYEHADTLGIDPAKIGVSGDSAGGTLAVTSTMMARDRGDSISPIFQLLLYPWLDDRGESDSYKRFTDVPLWNSTISAKMGPFLNPNPGEIPRPYHSPVEAETLSGMPPAYLEVAEFDCLHDDGILYARLLENEGIAVELHEPPGTIHGFDIMLNASITKKMIEARTSYMRKMFS